ncbi:MAG: antibiotic biosynthesis monooxygenase family protein [Gaiellaceae bacterium]
MIWQLRLYRVKEGALDDFAREWRDLVAPLRRERGFQVLGPWLAEDGRFVWLVGHEDFAAANEAYYASPERVAMEPDPARHLADVQTILLDEL